MSPCLIGKSAGSMRTLTQSQAIKPDPSPSQPEKFSSGNCQKRIQGSGALKSLWGTTLGSPCHAGGLEAAVGKGERRACRPSATHPAPTVCPHCPHVGAPGRVRQQAAWARGACGPKERPSAHRNHLLTSSPCVKGLLCRPLSLASCRGVGTAVHAIHQQRGSDSWRVSGRRGLWGRAAEDQACLGSCRRMSSRRPGVVQGGDRAGPMCLCRGGSSVLRRLGLGEESW